MKNKNKYKLTGMRPIGELEKQMMDRLKAGLPIIIMPVKVSIMSRQRHTTRALLNAGGVKRSRPALRKARNVVGDK